MDGLISCVIQFSSLFITMSSRILAFFFCICSLTTAAQQNDAGLWASASVEMKLKKRLSAVFTEEIRLNENLSQMGTLLTDLSVDYRFAKRWNVGLSYRFSKKKRTDTYFNTRQRYYTDLSFRIKLKHFSFTPRLRYQIQYSNINSSENGRIPEKHLRAKLTAKYNSGSRLTPFISVECYYRISNKEDFTDKVRYATGFNYEITAFHDIELFYLINKEVQVNDPLTQYNFGVGYKYNF